MYRDILFFNGTELDTDSRLKISENYQINDLFDLSTRQASYTNTFTIPKTDKNIDTLQGLGIVGTDSEAPYNLNSLTYFREGIQVFSNATAVIKETSSDFKINAYFGNNQIFEVISGKKISSLDLNFLNHDLNLTNYVNRVNGDILTYAVADYGAQEDGVIRLEYQIPSINVSYIWNKIFSEAGFSYKYTGRGNRNDYNPFITDIWNNSYMTIDKGFDNNLEVVPVTSQLTSNNSGFFAVYNRVIETQIEARFTGTNVVSYGNIAQQDELNFSVIQNNFFKIKISGTVIGNQITDLLELRVKKNGVVVDKIELNSGTNTLGFEERFYFEAGENLSFDYHTINNDAFLPIIFNTDINIELLVDNQNVRVNISNYFNSIDQKTFLKDIINFYGLTYKKNGTTYEFISYRELFDTTARYQNYDVLKPVNLVADDWSEKFNTLVSEKYSFGNYAQENKLRYLYDDEDDAFANSSFDIDDKTLPLTNTALTRIFKAPANSPLQAGGDTLKTMNLFSVDKDKIKGKSSAPYIFYAENRSGTFSYKTEAGQAQIFSGNYKVATFKELSFSFQKSKYLYTLDNLFKRTRHLTVDLILNERDIADLNFFKLKYIKQLGSYFYISKINNFQNNKTTRCEMLRVTQHPQLGEFSDDFSDAFNT